MQVEARRRNQCSSGFKIILINVKIDIGQILKCIYQSNHE